MPKAFKNLLVIVSIILVYFVGLRELRSTILNAHKGSILPSEYGSITEDLSFKKQNSVSYIFSYDTGDRVMTWKYKIAFGFFFLSGIIGLVLVGAKTNEYFYLIGIHIVGCIISAIVLFLGLRINNYFIIIADMISRYLIPLCSLGLVALSSIKKEQAITNE